MGQSSSIPAVPDPFLAILPLLEFMARKICAVLCARTVPVGGGLRVRPRRRDQGIPAVRGSFRPIPAHSGRN